MIGSLLLGLAAAAQQPATAQPPVRAARARQAYWPFPKPDPAKSRRECKTIYMVGSRIGRRVCGTVGEWEAIAAATKESLDSMHGLSPKSPNVSYR